MTPTSDLGVPIRSCVGCGRRAPAVDLVRVALVDGVAVVDRHAPGRGAWLCGPGCMPGALKRRGFQRAWRTDVAPAVLDELATRMASAATADEMGRCTAEIGGERVAIGAPAARLADRRKVTLRRGEEVSGT